MPRSLTIIYDFWLAYEKNRQSWKWKLNYSTRVSLYFLEYISSFFLKRIKVRITQYKSIILKTKKLKNNIFATFSISSVCLCWSRLCSWVSSSCIRGDTNYGCKTSMFFLWLKSVTVALSQSCSHAGFCYFCCDVCHNFSGSCSLFVSGKKVYLSGSAIVRLILMFNSFHHMIVRK